MRTRSRALLAALAVALLLALAAGGASADRLSVSERSFRITWAPLTIGLQDGPGGEEGLFFPASCNVTMAGSFHSSSFAKVARSLIGFITQASVDTRTCDEEGTFQFLGGSLPWHVIYVSFTGLLPRIERVTAYFIGMSVSVSSTFSCLIRSTSLEPAGWELQLSAVDGAIQRIVGDADIFIFADGLFPCDQFLIYYAGEGIMTTADGRSSIRFSLI